MSLAHCKFVQQFSVIVHFQVVHTQAKIIDQDVMYKYISKNLLFVATVAPKASGEIGIATPEESWLVVYLIDTVTGRVLHRMTHHGSRGPVHAVSFQSIFTYCLLILKRCSLMPFVHFVGYQ